MRRTSDPKLTRLRQVPGLGGMSDAELVRLASLVDECDLPEGTVLMREGTIGRSSYVVVDGWAAVSVSGTVLAALGPGDHIGEMAMMDNRPRSATVTAKTQMKVLVIGPEAMSIFLDQPHVVRAIATGLSSRLRVSDSVAVERDGEAR